MFGVESNNLHQLAEKLSLNFFIHFISFSEPAPFDSIGVWDNASPHSLALIYDSNKRFIAFVWVWSSLAVL